MEKLDIQGESDRPDIHLDHEAGSLYIGGNSLPENVNEIYQPVLEWIDAYIQHPNPKTTFEFFFVITSYSIHYTKLYEQGF